MTEVDPAMFDDGFSAWGGVLGGSRRRKEFKFYNHCEGPTEQHPSSLPPEKKRERRGLRRGKEKKR